MFSMPYKLLQLIFTKAVMRGIYRKALLLLSNTKFWDWLLLVVIPKIRFTTYYTNFRGWKYKQGYKKLEAGHILLCIDDKKLTTKLIGGTFTHAALCVNMDIKDQYEVAEMVAVGYEESEFFDLCRESTRVVIGKCTKWDPEYTKLVIDKCKSFTGTPYDTKFGMGAKALACSELIYHSDFEHRLESKLDDVAGLGIKYISPTGIFNSPNFEIVWDSDDAVEAA